MATFAVLGRSLFAFIVVAVIAAVSFLLADTRPLDTSLIDTELIDTESISAPTADDQAGSAEIIEAEDPGHSAETTVASPSTSLPELVPELSDDNPALTLEDLPQTGSGAFVPAGTTTGTTVGAGNIIEFSVAAEQGTGIDPDALAAKVDKVLADPRSWIAEGDIGFRRIETGGLFTVVVATAGTIDQLCAPLRTNGFFSCASNGWVALNLNRWMTATDSWTAQLGDYRDYVINHEVGHYLARPHVGCPGPGELAPIMMQQTKGLGECQPNGWPYPSPKPEPKPESEFESN